MRYRVAVLRSMCGGFACVNPDNLRFIKDKWSGKIYYFTSLHELLTPWFLKLYGNCWFIIRILCWTQSIVSGIFDTHGVSETEPVSVISCKEESKSIVSPVRNSLSVTGPKLMFPFPLICDDENVPNLKRSSVWQIVSRQWTVSDITST